MDREKGFADLEAVKKRLADIGVHIRRQREIIKILESAGHETGPAQAQLAEFKRTHLALVADRDRLLRSVSENTATSPRLRRRRRLRTPYGIR